MGKDTLDTIRSEALADEAPPPGLNATGGDGSSTSLAAPGAVDQAAIDAAEAKAWAEVPASFGSIICMAIPGLRDAYSPANCLRWGEAMTEVAKRHGWTARIVGPYLGVFFASVPMAIPTVMAVRAIRAARGDAAGATVASSVTSAVTDQAADAQAQSRPPKAQPLPG